jgi:hypothetical protein
VMELKERKIMKQGEFEKKKKIMTPDFEER